MNFFDVTNALVAERTHNYTDEVEAAYQPFLINRSLSNFYDCVMHAAEINRRPTLTKREQFDYYFHAIQPKKKRFAKWSKPAKDERVQVVSDYFACSITVAEQYNALLSDADVDALREKMYRGGRSKFAK